MCLQSSQSCIFSLPYPTGGVPCACDEDVGGAHSVSHKRSGRAQPKLQGGRHDDHKGPPGPTRNDGLKPPAGTQ